MEAKNVINVDNAVAYLLKKRLISIKSIVDGNISIVDVSRRNRNLKIAARNGKNFLLKQPRIEEPSDLITISAEPYLYNLIHNNSHFLPVKNLIPQLVIFDRSRNILVTDFIPGTITLNQFVSDSFDVDFLADICCALGDILATFHGIFDLQVLMNDLYFLPKAIPSIFFITRPSPQIFVRLSPANLKLLKTIQDYPELCAPLEKTHDEWKFQTVIHGDFRWDNILLFNLDKKDRKFDIKIVDWEFSDIGDPAWDIGIVLHEFLNSWIYSLHITGLELPKQLLASDHHFLRRMQNCIRSFWYRYIQVSHLSEKQAEALLKRSVKFSAVHMIQGVYESMLGSTQLSNRAIYMLQLSANILNESDDFIIHLLGVPLRS